MGKASKDVQRRFIDGFQSKGDVSVAEELLADDFVDHSPFGPIPPTGNAVSWGVIDIVRQRDGQLVEHWNQLDAYGLMVQLGAIPG